MILRIVAAAGLSVPLKLTGHRHVPLATAKRYLHQLLVARNGRDFRTLARPAQRDRRKPSVAHWASVQLRGAVWTALLVTQGRVEMWRGFGRSNISVSAVIAVI